MNIDSARVETDPSIDDPRLGGAGTWSTDKMAKNAYGDFVGERTGSSPLGRWPANCILGGDFNGNFPQSNSNANPRNRNPKLNREEWRMGGKQYNDTTEYGDKGSASRFFYNVSEDEKLKGLIVYLHKLVTPPNGKTMWLVPDDLIPEGAK